MLVLAMEFSKGCRRPAELAFGRTDKRPTVRWALPFIFQT